jgi:Tfp pilus assembly protein PilF
VKFTAKTTVLLLVIVGCLVYVNSIFNNFIGDDLSQIVENSTIRSLKNIPSFFTSSSFSNGNSELTGIYYKPLQTLSFSILYQLFGINPIGYHIYQVLLHIANAVIVLLFASRLFKKHIAFLLSIIFLIHPINSQTVMYISSTQDVLFFFFGMLALLWLMTFSSTRAIVVSSILLFLSLLSKESGVLFLGICTLYVFMFQKKRRLWFVICNAGIFLSYLFMRFHSVGLLTRSLSSPIDVASFSERLLTMPKIFFTYLKIFVFPFHLSSSYQWVVRQITLSDFFLPIAVDLLFIGMIGSLAIQLYRTNRTSNGFKIFMFFVAWFFTGLLIHLQIIPLDYTLTESWFYFPIIGLLGMIGVVLERLNVFIVNKRVITVIAIVLLLLAARTVVRSFDWRDDLRLASVDIRVSPESYDLENLIGLGLLRNGQIYDAKRHIERSIQLYPYITNYINLGLVYIYLQDYVNAKEAYMKSLQFGDYAPSYEALGSLTIVTGGPRQNIEFLTMALAKFPQNPKLWQYLAIINYQQGNKEEAKGNITKAYSYDPSQNTGAIYNMIMLDQPLKLNIQPSK